MIFLFLNFRFVSSFDRPNLKYQVLPKGNKASVLKDIIDLIKTKFPNKCGIVYCFSRNECDVVADELKRARILSTSYHAGLSDKKRIEVQTSWTKDKIKVIFLYCTFWHLWSLGNVWYVVWYNPYICVKFDHITHSFIPEEGI